jgi:hypothetical protein
MRQPTLFLGRDLAYLKSSGIVWPNCGPVKRISSGRAIRSGFRNAEPACIALQMVRVILCLGWPSAFDFRVQHLSLTSQRLIVLR